MSRINYASGPYGTVSSITYDSNSNRTAYGATSYTIPSTNNKMSNAGGTAITYTNAGNVKAIGADTFIFNKENQLSQATVSGTATTFTYDAFWNRLRSTTGGVQTQTLYGLDSEVLFQSTGGVQTNYAYLDGMPLAVIQPATATLSMIHTDRLGTPQRATNASKTVVWTGDYQPFGAVTPTTSITMNLRMPGQFVDATGFYHNGFRDYIPSYGRYLEADPIGLAGGMNPFVYANNNPFKWTDRLGLNAACLPGEEDCGRNDMPIGSGGGGALPPQAITPGQQCTTGRSVVPYQPPNDGFAKAPTRTTLQPGQLMDRYGFDGGTYASPAGTPFAMRSLRPEAADLPLSTFRVAKPFTVQSGQTAPALGQPGGGVQYKFYDSIQTLLETGYIVRVGQ